MKRKPGSFLSVLIAVLMGVLALLSPSCGGGTAEPVEETVPEPEAPVCPLAEAQVLTASDGSYVTLDAGIDIDPCATMTAAHVPLADLPDKDCLPCDPERAVEGECLFSQAESITAIDVTPDGTTFTPAATLSYKLPVVPWTDTDTLFIFQHDPTKNCNLGAYQTSWVSVSTSPASVRTPSYDFADGPFNHTCIFLLVDLQGRFNAMGTLLQQIEWQPDDTLFVTLDVAGSSTHPDLEGQQVTFGLYGVQHPDGVDALFDLLASRFSPGTMLLMHFESTGNMVIWSDREMARFTVGNMDW